MDGLMNAMREPVVSLGLAGGASVRLIDAVIDTGFTGWLTLPPDVVADMDLSSAGISYGVLADGREVALDTYYVTVMLEGEPRRVIAQVAPPPALAGMELFDGDVICIEDSPGGAVTIQPNEDHRPPGSQ